MATLTLLLACSGAGDNCATSSWRDADGDGWGGDREYIGCNPPHGYVPAGGDCDDENPSISPSVAEICGNGADDNCAPGGCRPGEDPVPEPWITADELYLELGMSLAAGDANGDGIEDILVGAPGWNASEGGGAIFYGPSDARTWAEADEVLLADPAWSNHGAAGLTSLLLDVDGDGGDDIVLGAPGWNDAHGEVYVGATDRVFEGDDGAVGLGTALAGGDVDGDGRDDLAVTTYDGWGGDPAGVYIVRGGAMNGGPVGGAWLQVSDLGDGAAAVVLADFDGDGRDDLAMGESAPNTIHIELALGPGARSVADADQEVELPRGALTLASGDVDGDGVGDLVVGGGPDVLLVRGLLSDGPALDEVIAGALSTALAVGDLDGDGRADIVASDSTYTGGEVAMVYGPARDGGPDQWRTYDPAGIPFYACALAIADTTGDGARDLHIGAWGDGTVQELGGGVYRATWQGQ